MTIHFETPDTAAGVEFAVVDSPIGKLLLTSQGPALTGLYMSTPGLPVIDDQWQEGSDVLDKVTYQLERYFAGELRDFDLTVATSGTDFQRTVWQALTDIDYGKTWSYAELANAAGRPGAFRAAGSANGRNRIAVIIPCHRVIASDKTLGGYGGGLSRKRTLLDLENAYYRN